VCDASALWCGRGVGPGTALMAAGGDYESFEALESRMAHLIHDKTMNEMLQIALSRSVRGLGGKAAAAIATECPTLAHLTDFLATCAGVEEAEAKLQALCRRAGSRAISSTSARALWELYAGKT
jgi:hypothetical protein